MRQEDKEHIKEEISVIQDRLNQLTKQLDEKPEETIAPQDTDVIRDEDIPVVYIDTTTKATEVE